MKGILFLILFLPIACSGFTLTEFSFDGTNEWIEFYNESSSTLSGTLILSGVKSGYHGVDIDIQTGETVVLVDNGSAYEETVSCVVYDNQGLSLSDSKELHIDRFLSGTMYSGSVRISIDTINSLNNTPETLSLVDGNYIGATSTYCNQELVVPPVEELDDNSEADIDQGVLIITEIQPYKDILPEYLEVQCTIKECLGIYTIEGLGHGGASKSIDIQIASGSLLVITSDQEFGKELGLYAFAPTISLADGGESLSIYGQYGQVMDTAVYSGKKLIGSSFYSSGSNLFTIQDRFSPGFTVQLYSLLHPKEELSTTYCSIRLQNNKGFYASNKVNLIASVGGKDIQNSSKTYACIWTSIGSDELLEGCNPGYIGFHESGIYTVTLDVYSQGDAYCSTSMSLNLPSKDVSEGIKEPNRTNYYKGLYLKRKEKYEEEVKSKKVVKSSSQAEKIIEDNTTLGPLSIIKLLPNPQGKDSLSEQMIIKNNSSIEISLEGWKVSNGSSNRYLETQVIKPFSQIDIIGNLGLTNSSSCISLQKDTYRSKDFCYSSPIEGIWIENSLESIGTADTAVIKKLSLKEFDNEWCISIQKEKILCTEKKYTKIEIEDRKKIIKKYESLQKRYSSLQDKYTKKQQSVTSLVSQKQKINEKLLRNTLYFFVETLRENYPLVYDSGGFKKIYNDWRVLTNELKNDHQRFAYGGVTGSIEDIENYNKLSQGTPLLQKQQLDKYIASLYQQTTYLLDDYIP